MIHQKACARGGCTATITAKGPKTLDARTYCSTRCGAIESLRKGWRPPRLSSAEARARGKNGGRARGVTMHRRRVAMMVQAIEGRLPEGVLDALDRQQLAALRKAFVEVGTYLYNRAYLSGMTAKGRAAQQARQRLKGQAA